MAPELPARAVAVGGEWRGSAVTGRRPWPSRTPWVRRRVPDLENVSRTDVGTTIFAVKDGWPLPAVDAVVAGVSPNWRVRAISPARTTTTAAAANHRRWVATVAPPPGAVRRATLTGAASESLEWLSGTSTTGMVVSDAPPPGGARLVEMARRRRVTTKSGLGLAGLKPARRTRRARPGAVAESLARPCWMHAFERTLALPGSFSAPGPGGCGTERAQLGPSSSDRPKGREWPSTRAKSVDANEYRSEVASGRRPSTTSGGACSQLAETAPLRVSAPPSILAMPKSPSLGSRKRETIALAGFTSRCTTPARWADSSAPDSLIPMTTASATPAASGRSGRRASLRSGTP